MVQILYQLYLLRLPLLYQLLLANRRTSNLCMDAEEIERPEAWMPNGACFFFWYTFSFLQKKEKVDIERQQPQNQKKSNMPKHQSKSKMTLGDALSSAMGAGSATKDATTLALGLAKQLAPKAFGLLGLAQGFTSYGLQAFNGNLTTGQLIIGGIGLAGGIVATLPVSTPVVVGGAAVSLGASAYLFFSQ